MFQTHTRSLWREGRWDSRNPCVGVGVVVLLLELCVAMYVYQGTHTHTHMCEDVNVHESWHSQLLFRTGMYAAMRA